MSVSMTCLWTLSYRSPMRLCAAGELFMHLVFLIKRERERGRERMEGKMCQSQYKKRFASYKMHNQSGQWLCYDWRSRGNCLYSRQFL